MMFPIQDDNERANARRRLRLVKYTHTSAYKFFLSLV